MVERFYFLYVDSEGGTGYYVSIEAEDAEMARHIALDHILPHFASSESPNLRPARAVLTDRLYTVSTQRYPLVGELISEGAEDLVKGSHNV